MIRKLLLAAICSPLLPALTLSQASAAPAVTPPASPPSPLPIASRGPAANAKLAGTSNVSSEAPHIISAGRKSLPTYGYMKQASDDRDGLSRLQDQARQLSPPR